MKAKDFFRQVQAAEGELKIINAKLQHFEDLGMKTGSWVGGTPGNQSRSSSRTELAACGAVDALRELVGLQRKYVAIIAKTDDVIKQIPQEKYRQLLSFYYLCGKSLRWISDELDYTDPNSVYRAHGWALREAQKILDKENDDGKQREI